MDRGISTTMRARKVIYDDYTNTFYVETRVEALERQVATRAKLTDVLNRSHDTKLRNHKKQINNYDNITRPFGGCGEGHLREEERPRDQLPQRAAEGPRGASSRAHQHRALQDRWRRHRKSRGEPPGPLRARGQQAGDPATHRTADQRQHLLRQAKEAVPQDPEQEAGGQGLRQDHDHLSLAEDEASGPEPTGVGREERGGGVFPDRLQAAHPATHHRAMGAPPGGRRQRGDHPGLPLHGGRGGPAVRGPKRPGPRVLSACRLRDPGPVLVSV